MVLCCRPATVKVQKQFPNTLDSQMTVDNGVVNCKGSTCELKTCDQGFMKLKTANGQSKKAKCVSTKNNLKWNKQLFQCRTCSNMDPLVDNNDFKVSCSFVKKSGFQLKKCSFQCHNGEKVQPAGKKKMTNLMCKCKTTEADDQCHWRKGSATFDLGDEDDFSNWYCSNEPTPPPTTTSSTSTTTSTTIGFNFDITPGNCGLSKLQPRL